MLMLFSVVIMDDKIFLNITYDITHFLLFVRFILSLLLYFEDLLIECLCLSTLGLCLCSKICYFFDLCILDGMVKIKNMCIILNLFLMLNHLLSNQRRPILRIFVALV